MSSFQFLAEKAPFPQWLGPYSPSRGNMCGMRVRSGQFGAWISSRHHIAFQPFVETTGGRLLGALVEHQWGGGRVLLLPTGHVIKPLPEPHNRGRRVLIGRFTGGLILPMAGGRTVDLLRPGLRPGDRWLGPHMGGLECIIGGDGALRCDYTHPTQYGDETTSAFVNGPNATLAAGFRTCRMADASGRVRVTESGHVTTMRDAGGGVWDCLYVGWVDHRTWANWNHYAVRR
jgi:hypothetical protein